MFSFHSFVYIVTRKKCWKSWQMIFTNHLISRRCWWSWPIVLHQVSRHIKGAVYNLQTVGLFRTDLICFHLHGDVSLVFPLFLFWASVTKVIGDICTQAIDEKISYPHIGHGSYNLEKVLNFSSRSYWKVHNELAGSIKTFLCMNNV